MFAHRTKLIVIPAAKRRAYNGIELPDNALVKSKFAIIASAGDDTDLDVGDVIWFNPDQLSSDVSDNRGDVELIAIDVDAVLGVTDIAEASTVFGVEFPKISSRVAGLFENRLLDAIESAASELKTASA